MKWKVGRGKLDVLIRVNFSLGSFHPLPLTYVTLFLTIRPRPAGHDADVPLLHGAAAGPVAADQGPELCR